MAMKTDTATYPAPSHIALKPSGAGQSCAPESAASPLPLYAPLLLLIRWMLNWAVYGNKDELPSERPVFRRRHQWFHDLYGVKLPRRLRRRSASQMRRNNIRDDDYVPFFTLLNDTKSKRDFNEKMSRVSAYDRIYLYGMRGYKLLPLTKATLAPLAFTPMATPVTSLINSGVWDAHTIPD